MTKDRERMPRTADAVGAHLDAHRQLGADPNGNRAQRRKAAKLAPVMPKALDVSAGIEAHDHTNETGHPTTLHKWRDRIDWCCQDSDCESYGI